MARCPQCEYPIPDDRERVGARCPNCRDPLYEPPGRVARVSREGEASCAVHAGMESVGLCLHCNNYVCETCRTRWRGKIICVACLENILTSREAAPEQVREPFRQGRTSVLIGGLVWLIALLALAVLGWIDASYGRTAIIVTFLVFVGLAASVLLAATGVGLALASLRTGSGSRGMALTGLVLTGLYVGVALGVCALGLWQY